MKAGGNKAWLMRAVWTCTQFHQCSHQQFKLNPKWLRYRPHPIILSLITGCKQAVSQCLCPWTCQLLVVTVILHELPDMFLKLSYIARRTVTWMCLVELHQFWKAKGFTSCSSINATVRRTVSRKHISLVAFPAVRTLTPTNSWSLNKPSSPHDDLKSLSVSLGFKRHSLGLMQRKYRGQTSICCKLK